jgi:hypothetical protein
MPIINGADLQKVTHVGSSENPSQEWEGLKGAARGVRFSSPSELAKFLISTMGDSCGFLMDMTASEKKEFKQLTNQMREEERSDFFKIMREFSIGMTFSDKLFFANYLISLHHEKREHFIQTARRFTSNIGGDHRIWALNSLSKIPTSIIEEVAVFFDRYVSDLDDSQKTFFLAFVAVLANSIEGIKKWTLWSRELEILQKEGENICYVRFFMKAANSPLVKNRINAL